MFLNFIKIFLAKKRLNRILINVSGSYCVRKIRSVGVFIDGNFFYEKESLLRKLEENGIQKGNIKVLIYRSHLVNKGSELIVSDKDIGWFNRIKNKEVQLFVEENFDLLISYYDSESFPLFLITNQSKADFKVGFSSVDVRLNHLMFNLDSKKYEVFMDELFKYLKILNKL